MIDSLEDIRSRCLQIVSSTKGFTFDQFIEHEFAPHAVERHLEVIGIAAVRIRELDPDFYEEFNALQPAVAVRNRLAHGYDDDIDHHILWGIIQNSLPTLIQLIDDQLKSG